MQPPTLSQISICICVFNRLLHNFSKLVKRRLSAFYDKLNSDVFFHNFFTHSEASVEETDVRPADGHEDDSLTDTPATANYNNIRDKENIDIYSINPSCDRSIDGDKCADISNADYLMLSIRAIWASSLFLMIRPFYHLKTARRLLNFFAAKANIFPLTEYFFISSL